MQKYGLFLKVKWFFVKKLLHPNLEPRPVLGFLQQVVVMADILLIDFLAVHGNDLVADLELLVAVDAAGEDFQRAVGRADFVGRCL